MGPHSQDLGRMVHQKLGKLRITRTVQQTKYVYYSLINPYIPQVITSYISADTSSFSATCWDLSSYVSGATVVYSDDARTEGTTASFVCDEGSLSGASSLTCNSGLWSDDIPTCGGEIGLNSIISCCYRLQQIMHIAKHGKAVKSLNST